MLSGRTLLKPTWKNCEFKKVELSGRERQFRFRRILEVRERTPGAPTKRS
jgi:hypothetical protein